MSLLGPKQEQAASEHSIAVQAGGSVTITTGPSVTEIREMMGDMLRAHFSEMQGRANGTARERGTVITDRFLGKMQDEYPEGLKQAEDPDFQSALLTVQKEYARCGDDELGNLLVDLLVDRSKQPQRNILQIVLNEAMHVAPKLTSGQLATLSVIFVMRYVKVVGVRDQAHFAELLGELLSKFAGSILVNQSTFQHLAFTGCGSSQIMGSAIEDGYLENYPGIFQKGFENTNWMEEAGIGGEAIARLVGPCQNDSKLLQLNILDIEALSQAAEEFKLTPGQTELIKKEFLKNRMSTGEAGARLGELMPFMKTILEAWQSPHLRLFTLTSVGIAIAHANIKSVLEREFADLRIWIN